ncbi:hypothetical protein [Streptomyces werraensis]
MSWCPAVHGDAAYELAMCHLADAAAGQQQNATLSESVYWARA